MSAVEIDLTRWNARQSIEWKLVIFDIDLIFDIETCISKMIIAQVTHLTIKQQSNAAADDQHLTQGVRRLF